MVGEPIVTYRKSAPASEAYLKLAKEIERKTQGEMMMKKKKRGLDDLIPQKSHATFSEETQDRRQGTREP